MDGADRADRVAGIAAARSLERLVGEGQHGFIGRVGGTQPVDAGLELVVGGEEAALVAAHTDKVFVSKGKLDLIDYTKSKLMVLPSAPASAKRRVRRDIMLLPAREH